MKDENGCAQLYRYSSDQSGHFASLEGSLVSVSMHQLTVLDEQNKTLYDEAVKFNHRRCPSAADVPQPMTWAERWYTSCRIRA